MFPYLAKENQFPSFVAISHYCLQLDFFFFLLYVINLMRNYPIFWTKASTREFAEAVCAYRIIFPDSEDQLIKLAQDLVTKYVWIIEVFFWTCKLSVLSLAFSTCSITGFYFFRHFESTQQQIRKQITSSDLLGILRKYSISFITSSVNLIFVILVLLIQHICYNIITCLHLKPFSTTTWRTSLTLFSA